MKKLKIIFLLIILSFVISLNISYSTPVRRALIIAIENYPSNSGFPSVKTLDDVPLIKTTLLNRMFEEKNIKVLIDKEATGKGILSAFEELLKISNQEDIVVIHYSGHGQQIQSNDINKPLSIDEALVAYDAKILPAPDYPDYYGQNHIRDKVIGDYIKKIRLKLGKNGMLNLFIDCCYSGTMTKGIEMFRGADDMFGTPEFKKKYFESGNSKIVGNYMYNCISESSENENKDKMSGFVFFAPCTDNVQSLNIPTNEGKSIGPLTYAISKAFAIIQNKKNATYRDLFDIICATIIYETKQQPQAEGDLDNVVFSPLVSYSIPYYSIIDYISGEYILNGGEFNGLFPNSIVGFYPEGTDDPSGIKPLFEMELKKVKNFESRIELRAIKDKGSDEELMKLRAFIIKQGLPERKLKIKFLDLDVNYITKLSEAITSVDYMSVVESDADFLLTGLKPNTNTNDGKLYVLSGKDGTSSSEPFDLSEINFEQKVKEKLKDLFVYNLLRELPLTDPNYGVGIDVELLEWINYEKKEYKLSSLNTISGVKNIKCGETVKLTVTNTGNNDAYITLLNFAPDGSLKQVIPEKGKDKANLLPKGNKMEFGFKSNDPGMEIYKVFATKDFISFDPIISSRGLYRTKGDKNPLEELLFDCYSGSKGSQGSLSGGATNEVFITVTK